MGDQESDKENHTIQSILLVAQNIPQVYVAVRLITELKEQQRKAHITVFTQDKHASHFDGLDDVGLTYDFLDKTFDLTIYVGHSYFLDDALLRYIDDLRGSRVWVNAHFEVEDLRQYADLSVSNRPISRCFDHIFYESQDDEKALIELGFHASTLHVTPSLKYDCAQASPLQKSTAVNRLARIGFIDRPLIVAASTVFGEESECIAQAFSELRVANPNLKLIVAPRRFEHVQPSQEQLEAKGLRVALETQIDTANFDPHADVLVIDGVGSLKGYFHLATVAVMGRSFSKRSVGGSNLMEPACESLPIVVGAHINPTCPHIRTFLKADAVQLAHAGNPLKSVLQTYFDDPNLRACQGRHSHNVYLSNVGGVKLLCRALVLKG